MVIHLKLNFKKSKRLSYVFSKFCELSQLSWAISHLCSSLEVLHWIQLGGMVRWLNHMAGSCHKLLFGISTRNVYHYTLIFLIFTSNWLLFLVWFTQLLTVNEKLVDAHRFRFRKCTVLLPWHLVYYKEYCILHRLFMNMYYKFFL